MLANNVVTILMIVFSWITLMGVLAWAGILVPRQLDGRKQRQIAQLTAGTEALAIAIARGSHDPQYLARLSAQYTAHVHALTQLGAAVPVAPAAAPVPLAEAA